MIRPTVVVALLTVFLDSNAVAQPPRSPPPSVTNKIRTLDAACTALGGRPGGGAYIFTFDFDGDGVSDYLISEGNYNCQGKPDAFKPGGKALVEIYVTQAADAPRAFSEVVRAYRIMDSRPRTVQIIREGAACSPGFSGPCSVTLRWDAGARRFVGGTNASPAPSAGAIDPLAAVGARAAPSPVAEPPPAALAAGAPENQTDFLSRCQRERMARYKGLTATIAASSCKQIWTQAQASMGAAAGLLAVGGGAPGPMTQAAVRSAITGVVWGGAVGKGMPATGKQGAWQVQLHGQTLIDSVGYQWGKVGQPIPYDVPEAMRIKGARLTEVACQSFGAGEQTRIFRVDYPGRPAFGLTVYALDAPTASANSTYTANADLKGPVPTLAALKRTPEGVDYKARCDD